MVKGLHPDRAVRVRLLTERFHPLVAPAVHGVVWGTWHLPLPLVVLHVATRVTFVPVACGGPRITLHVWPTVHFLRSLWLQLSLVGGPPAAATDAISAEQRNVSRLSTVR